MAETTFRDRQFNAAFQPAQWTVGHACVEPTPIPPGMRVTKCPTKVLNGARKRVGGGALPMRSSGGLTAYAVARR